MTTPRDGAPIAPPHFADMDSSTIIPKQRKSPLGSLASLPYRRSNPSLNSLLASTSSLPSSRPSSASGTPRKQSLATSGLLPTPSIRSPSPATAQPSLGEDDPRSLIWRSFAPYVSVIASSDADELIKQKGFPGGFLELIRPFGETITGKVIIRDSNGVGRTWEDFGVRFVGVKDGLGGTKPRRSVESSRRSVDSRAETLNGSDPASQRVGGDIGHIEEVVDKHLVHAEYNAGVPDYFDFKDRTVDGPTAHWHWLYLRRLMSSLPMTPHETFSHPVACVIAISSRDPAPIDELRRLYDSTNSGEYRLPLWVNNEFLRYYVLVHDDDHDDFRKSSALYERMTKSFGLHCHLLRLRSAQCVSSDDDSLKLPFPGWISAGEELAEIQRRENADEVEDPTPCLFDSDATAIRIFVRELVTQSIIPSMERLSAQWNEQVASRRRGIGGRFLSLSKRWTGFGTPSRASSGSGLQTGAGGNYDSLQGFYRPDAPEAIMRKLADYAFMLRDFKLARETYDLLRQDYNNDKAWKYYAGANEMTALTTLLTPQNSSSKSSTEKVDQLLETASYSYIMRSNTPYYALRTLALGVELLKLRGSSAIDEAAKWAGRIIEQGLVGPVGHVLFTERTGALYASRHGVGPTHIGSRQRKAALWAVLAADAWLRQEKILQAERCLKEARNLYGLTDEEPKTLEFEGMKVMMDEIQEGIKANTQLRTGTTYEEPEDEAAEEATLVEEVSEQFEDRRHAHRKSLIGAGQAPFVAPEGAPLAPARTISEESSGFRDDNFE